MKGEWEREDRIDAAMRELVEGDAGDCAYGPVDENRRSAMVSEAVAQATTESSAPVGIGRSWKKVAVVLAAGLAAAAVAAIVVFVGGGKPEASPATSTARASALANDGTALGRFSRTAGVVVDGEPVHATAALLSGQEVEIRETGVLVELGRGIRLAPTSGSSFSVTRGEAGRLVVSLHRGAVWSTVDPEKKSENLSVETSRGVVDVKGTVFAVELEMGAVTVKVFRGTVEVREKEGGLRLVSAGKMLTMGAPRVEEMDDRVRDEAFLFAARLGLTSAGGEVISVDDIGAAAPKGDGGTSVAATRKAREEASPSVDTLLARIRTSRADGDWRNVEIAYTQLIRFHFSTDDARAAMVALGTVRLEKLDDPAGALGSFSSYLATGATALEPEALYGKASALGELGDFAGERNALSTFVSRFPSNPQVPAARQRLASMATE